MCDEAKTDGRRGTGSALAERPVPESSAAEARSHQLNAEDDAKTSPDTQGPEDVAFRTQLDGNEMRDVLMGQLAAARAQALRLEVLLGQPQRAWLMEQINLGAAWRRLYRAVDRATDLAATLPPWLGKRYLDEIRHATRRGCIKLEGMVEFDDEEDDDDED